MSTNIKPEGAVMFVSKNSGYKMILMPILHRLSVHGERVVDSRGIDVKFKDGKYTTSDSNIIEKMRKNKAFGVDFYEAKKMTAAVKAKVDAALKPATVVQGGVVGTQTDVSLNAERDQLAKDKAAFEKEKKDWKKEKGDDSGSLPPTSETGEGDTPLDPDAEAAAAAADEADTKEAAKILAAETKRKKKAVARKKAAKKKK